MDRIIGIDFGRKRIGLAVSDPLIVFASALETVPSAKIIDYIKNYAQKETIIRFVVGYPKNMNNTIGPRGEASENYARLLTETYGFPVTLWDERLTTMAAERMLIDADVSRKKRKTVIDKMAAVMILQGYLDSKN